MDPAAADEHAGCVTEHPDAETVLLPVGKLASEEVARLDLRLRRRAEGREDPLVAMKRQELGEVRLRQRHPTQAGRDDDVATIARPAITTG